ncbi:MAG TPA: GIY-YIG nuclease family protein [Polyangiales bacterium]|nr:GIY-YIG nuclease family protein [Polyangiales bacterium]
MGVPLREMRLLVLDAQASGATPMYGDLIELGWALVGPEPGPVRSHWVIPRTERWVPKAVRELTGWSPDVLSEAVSEHEAWELLLADARSIAEVAPVAIHYASFELPFLQDLHARLGEGAFPFAPICVHAIAARLYPQLPRRSIRALAGFLGHSAELMRRTAGHVEATAFIWSALLEPLAERGVETLEQLQTWLSETRRGERKTRGVYPLPAKQRLALPDKPGVYRFLRSNGDILYVGKATSLKKRVASHFTGSARATERALEMLTQVHEIRATETPSILEAALLETDEIKRIDPPYNVQLRIGERAAWFASRDLRDTVKGPDETHRVGPLPSARALMPLSALRALAAGDDSAYLRAGALAVPIAELPDDALFLEGYGLFTAEHYDEAAPARRVDRAARNLWLARGRKEPEVEAVEDAPLWDLARVRRRLERALVQTGLLLRRTRWLRMLGEADIAYRERGMPQARALIVAGGEIVAQQDLESLAALDTLPVRRPQVLRSTRYDAASYDRLRVLATELRRVQDDGGELALRFASHAFHGARLDALLRMV